MSLIGYARISTAEGRQVLHRQFDALNAAGCDRIFEDRASNGVPKRPNLAACLDCLRSGDVLVVQDLDRLGRLAGELIALIDGLNERGVDFRALNSPMDTTTPAGRSFLQIQAAFAEMERNVIRQRVREGLKAARARGRKGGRAPCHDAGEAPLRPEPDGGPDALHSGDLPGAGRNSRRHVVPLPLRRRHVQGTRPQTP